MRTYRLAEPKDLTQLVALAHRACQPDAELPDIAFVADFDGQIVAAVGIELNNPDAVVASGGVIHPAYYRNPFVVFRLQEAMEDWLIQHGCHAYVCSVAKRNTRMQRWMERLGAKCYAKEGGAYWYARTIGPERNRMAA
jgi:RimJ/RimL family protein N-acetyltransferase